MNPGCPACGARTELVRWDDVAGFECGACDGHFVRAPSLAKFFEKHALTHRFERLVQNARDAPEATRNLICTHCHASSFRALQVGVVEIDVCASCTSVYFDADEATQYFRQARFKASGGKVAQTGVATADVLAAIIDIITTLIP
jgi:Zn-finger nucleic acid-binding protein